MFPEISPVLRSLSLILLLALLGQTTEQVVQKRSEKISDKFAPNDHFDLMRSYPDLVPDHLGYEQGMQQAYIQSIHATRSNGFDEEWTIEGPGNIGARINTIAVPEGQMDTIYIGYARGGIFRTYDGGSNWTSIFDQQNRLSMGSIAINPLNHQVIYAGTGDKNIPGLFSIGDGVYKSYDGGDNWTHIGLEDQRIVSEIAVHPTDTNIVFAACMGLPSVPNSDRGLYKSTNGGATWTQVLHVGDSAGINDIALHPTDPNILYASGWNRIRTNQASIFSGNASRIWKSTDGGSNWTQLGNGLPVDDLGRVGISMFTPNPDTLYALYVDSTSQLQGVYRTFDGGSSWSTIPTATVDANALGGFGWYFSGIYVNPYDYEDVFFSGVQLWRTQNSGSLWNEADPPWWQYTVHADKHDMAFIGPNTYLLATDGGLYLTTDGATSWSKIENIKSNEFYRVAHTHLDPENYYGGMQDNGTSGGNASNAVWPRIYGGDGFQVRFHPSDPDLFYAETQNGNIVYTDNGGFNFNSVGVPWGSERKNWDTPYLLSHHNPSIMYTGSYRIWKDAFSPFAAWTAISDDLTDGIIYGSGFHTISTVEESPLNADHLYAGTTDANVWRSLNGGSTWDSIHTGLPNRYVTSVKASLSNDEHLFVTHSGYKYNDYIPHVHKSTNNGNSWTDISGDLPQVAVNDIIIYPGYNDSVLFIATDAGVYGTITAGADWERMGTNMPMIATFDLELDTVNNRLVAGTVGRSIMTYPLDSLVTIPIDTNDSSAFIIVMNPTPKTCTETDNGSIDATVTGGTFPYTYQWSNGQTTEDIGELSSGTYSVTVTDNTGETTVGSASIIHNPIHPQPTVGPISGPFSTQAWVSFNYTVPVTSGSSFDWSVTGGTLNGTAGNTALVLWHAGPDGELTVTETDANGCISSESMDVNILFVGVDEALDKAIQLYPNPASDVVHVSLPSIANRAHLTIRDAKGAVVHQTAVQNQNHVLDASCLTQGVYHVEIRVGESSVQRKLIVQ